MDYFWSKKDITPFLPQVCLLSSLEILLFNRYTKFNSVLLVSLALVSPCTQECWLVFISVEHVIKQSRDKPDRCRRLQVTPTKIICGFICVQTQSHLTINRGYR